jgi:two-component system response regulator VicR
VEEQEIDYKKTIMIVDDEKMIINLLTHNLTREGYNVIEANDGLEAIEKAKSEKPDLILLDIMLPKIDGLSVCKRIKNMMNVPIIMVTAKDEELDKIVGLELGADDYITKPFSVRELLARVKANLRKADINSNIQKENEQKAENGQKELKRTNIIKVGILTLDLDRFEVMVGDKIVDLTLREFEVLKFLVSEPGQVITRETLLEKVWGYEYYGDIRTVDVTVRRIREKIEKDTSNPKILITKRGVGYYIAT